MCTFENVEMNEIKLRKQTTVVAKVKDHFIYHLNISKRNQWTFHKYNYRHLIVSHLYIAGENGVVFFFFRFLYHFHSFCATYDLFGRFNLCADRRLHAFFSLFIGVDVIADGGKCVWMGLGQNVEKFFLKEEVRNNLLYACECLRRYSSIPILFFLILFSFVWFMCCVPLIFVVVVAFALSLNHNRSPHPQFLNRI